jgi:hypothetical protein
VASATLANAGTYAVKASAGGVELMSSAVRVGVLLDAPVITSVAPSSQVRLAGQSATLSVVTSANGTLSYQWLKDGVAVAGGTSSTLTIGSVAAANAGNYRVEVRNESGAVQSPVARLELLSLTQQPQGRSIAFGMPVTLSAQAQAGEAAVSYQWYKDAQALVGGTSASLSVSSASLANVGAYSVKAVAGGVELMSSLAQLSVMFELEVRLSPLVATDRHC